jgi:hypothetical protein
MFAESFTKQNVELLIKLVPYLYILYKTSDFRVCYIYMCVRKRKRLA